MILVVGGTGLVGRSVVDGLALTRTPVRVLARRPLPPAAGWIDTAEVRIGDAADRGSLDAAMAGVQQVLLVMANGPQQHRLEVAVVDAAAAAGVEHLVKVSAPFVGANSPVAIARMHHAVEQHVLSTGARSGMRHTFLRPYAFMQNLLHNAATVRMAGFFAGITDAPMNMVNASDVADVAVSALLTEGRRGRALVLTGATTVSYPEVAEHLSVLGRPTRFLLMQRAEFAADLRRARLPQWTIEHLVEIQSMTLTNPETATTTVSDLTGRAPRTIERFLAENLSEFTGPRGPKERLAAIPLRLAVHRRVPVTPADDSARR